MKKKELKLNKFIEQQIALENAIYVAYSRMMVAKLCLLNWYSLN